MLIVWFGEYLDEKHSKFQSLNNKSFKTCRIQSKKRSTKRMCKYETQIVIVNYTIL